jgi:hypothetical protein
LQLAQINTFDLETLEEVAALAHSWNLIDEKVNIWILLLY